MTGDRTSDGGSGDLDALIGGLRARRPVVGQPGGVRAAPLAIADAATRRRWARGIAVSLGALAVAGLVTDAMAAAQLLDDAGPVWLAVVWPLGGLGLLAAAAVQSRFVDRFARLSMLRALLVAYAAAFGVAGLLFAVPAPTAVAAAFAWLLADQINFLVPLLVWALASDVFSAGQGLSTFPWISRFVFAGQVAGMAIAAVVGWWFDSAGSSLAWLLVIPIAVCAGVAVGLPRALRGATTGVGHGRVQSARESWKEALALVSGLGAFRWLLYTSLAVLAAGVVIEFSFLDVASARILGAADLQTFYATTALGGFMACWLIQATVTPTVLRRAGIASALAVLPVVTVVAATVMVVAGATFSVAAAVAGVLAWRLPRWSLDASARQAALATLPDERRARATFLIDLVPFAVALVVVPIPIGVGRLTDARWVPPVLAVALAAVAVVAVQQVRRRWDDTQLSWRLKRRKRLG
jgi:hypothetical protein